MNANSEATSRRPIKARNTNWAGRLTRILIKAGIRPNTISILSIFFALAASLCLFYSKNNSQILSLFLYILCAVFIQLRLLCNMLDGMVAIEGGFKSDTGAIFNELPDRIADTLIILPIGYLCGDYSFAVELGWLAILLAMLTAYIRLLGDTVGTRQYFVGPMAKQHRMFLITVSLLGAMVLQYFGYDESLFYCILWILVVGCIITFIRRLLLIANDLKCK